MDNEEGKAVSTAPRRKRKGVTRNTCGNSSLKKRLTRQLSGIMAHLEANPNDNLSRARVDTIKALLAE
jgi:hypothetical protein